jgi:hypothetical protein
VDDVERMKWLLYERHDAPVVATGWVARVGSANERPGITGISHFFEHMMFKGTNVIGTKDIALDLKLIEEQEQVREEMRAEMAVMRESLRRGQIERMDDPGQDCALQGTRGEVRRPGPQAAREHHQGPDGPDLHQERR